MKTLTFATSSVLKTTLERFWGHLGPQEGAMLGSKNVLDMPKSEKNDTEKHTENHIKKNIKT